MKGFQESSADEDHILASACCKHYLANSVEHSTEDNMTWDRFEINSVVTQQDLIDSCECTHGRQLSADLGYVSWSEPHVNWPQYLEPHSYGLTRRAPLLQTCLPSRAVSKRVASAV